MGYAIVIEKAGNNCSAYVSDLLGCVATGVSYRPDPKRWSSDFLQRLK